MNLIIKRNWKRQKGSGRDSNNLGVENSEIPENVRKKAKKKKRANCPIQTNDETSETEQANVTIITKLHIEVDRKTQKMITGMYPDNDTDHTSNVP